jgi:hypothetical protein
LCVCVYVCVCIMYKVCSNVPAAHIAGVITVRQYVYVYTYVCVCVCVCVICCAAEAPFWGILRHPYLYYLCASVLEYHRAFCFINTKKRSV